MTIEPINDGSQILDGENVDTSAVARLIEHRRSETLATNDELRGDPDFLSRKAAIKKELAELRRVGNLSSDELDEIC